MQRFQQTVKATFGKGLITEASEMGFPEDASVDELNVDLTRKATRRRRLAVKYEEGDTPSTATYPSGSLFHTQTWENVGEDSDLEYLVVQAGNKLRFYRKGLNSLSSGEVHVSNTDSTPYILDLSTFNHSGGLGASSSKIECTSIDGRLVVASPQINTFYIERNDDGSFTTSEIKFRIRDFEWLSDRTTLEVQSPTADSNRLYDTYNAGWFTQNGVNPLSTYLASSGGYPALTHPWYSGKNSSGDFSVIEWLKVTSGTSFLGNGHYILDLFTQDRSTVSGIAGLPSDPPTSRFSTVATYAGRVFYSGVDNRVYFSRVLEHEEYIGDLYQQNDPTAETFSDLLDTDGGYIRIPDANGIQKLHVFGASLLAFAKNGVWRISGVDDVFRATEFSVSKVSDFGLSVRNSFAVGANNLPFWWSYAGIHTIEVTENGGFREANISRNTIQTFFESIEGDAKSYVTSNYDAENDRIFWFYPNNDETIAYKLNNVLIFDVGLQAFVPWKISDKSSSTPYIVGSSYFKGKRVGSVVYNVVDSVGNQIVDSNNNEVVATIDSEVISENQIKLLVQNSDGTLSFATFSGVDFLDWGTADYSSFIVSSYNFIGDVTRFKTSPYITILMKVTETGVNADGTLIRPSSILVSSYWDFAKAPSTSPQQGYRFKRIPYGNPLTYPTSLLQTKLKLRGRGRVISLRFEAETGKDFDLIGWETIDAVNSNF